MSTMMVCEECGTEDRTVTMRVTEDDTFPLCGECAEEYGITDTQSDYLRVMLSGRRTV